MAGRKEARCLSKTKQDDKRDLHPLAKAGVTGAVAGAVKWALGQIWDWAQGL